MAESFLVGHTFVSGICQLKSKETLKTQNLKTYFFVLKKTRFLPDLISNRAFAFVNPVLMMRMMTKKKKKIMMMIKYACVLCEGKRHDLLVRVQPRLDGRPLRSGDQRVRLSAVPQ